jgi:hypothetical protein
MAAVASPYGLKPINLIGGQAFSGGTIREYYLPSNVAAAYYTGAVMYLNTNGVITPIAASPTGAQVLAAAGNAQAATAGIIGVCVGVRYVNPITLQPLHSQYLPSGAITAGYTDVWIKVIDDPDQLYVCQADTVVGSKTNGARGGIGQNVALKTFTGSTTTGLAATVLDTGANWGSLASGAATTTLAMRIVDILQNDTYPEVIVKFNAMVHSYYNPVGV